MTDEDRAVICQIADLNAQSLGEWSIASAPSARHGHLAAGRRALRAYSNHRL